MLETVWGLEVYEQETHLGSVFYSGIRTSEKIASCMLLLFGGLVVMCSILPFELNAVC